MENERKVICTQCGGTLIPDEECKIYRCTYCGVAFGGSLIFNPEASSKASASMHAGEFGEADIWYNCILMTDPHNYEALKGRVLCAAKWKRLGEITDKQAFSPVRMENVRKRINDGIEHADDADKEFFRKFEKLFDILEKIWDKDETTKLSPAKLTQLKEQVNTLRKELVLMGNKEIDRSC